MTAPTPTLATATLDYIPATGGRQFILVPSIVNPSAPTKAEISAGTDYTSAIIGVSGFNLSADMVANAPYGSRYNTQISGVLSSDECSWTLKASTTSVDARTQLTLLLNAFVVNANEGLKVSKKIDVWPVQISSANVDQVERDALATITVMFAITSQPVTGITVPTA